MNSPVIKQDIQKQTGGLTASVGVSYCKSLAKLASGQRKSDGPTVILPAEAGEVTARLPIEAFHGIGPKTAERMHALDVRTGLDLRRFTVEELQQRFGKAGHSWERDFEVHPRIPLNNQGARQLGLHGGRHVHTVT